MQINKMRYGMVLLPLGFVLVAWATLAFGATSSDKASQTLPQKAEAVESGTLSTPAEVTIDGQRVEVPENGTKTVKSGNNQATVQSVSTDSDTSKEKTTTVTQDNGNVNVSVSSSNTNRTGYGFTNVSSYSSNQSGSISSSSVQMNTNGVSRVTVTK